MTTNLQSQHLFSKKIKKYVKYFMLLKLNKILYEKLYPHPLFSSHVSDYRRILCFDSDTKHQAIIYISASKKPRDSHHEVFNKS